MQKKFALFLIQCDNVIVMDGDCSSSSDDASWKGLRRLPLGEKVQRFFYETFLPFLCYREVCMKKWILIVVAVIALSVSCATTVVDDNSSVVEENFQAPAAEIEVEEVPPVPYSIEETSVSIPDEASIAASINEESDSNEAINSIIAAEDAPSPSIVAEASAVTEDSRVNSESEHSEEMAIDQLPEEEIPQSESSWIQEEEIASDTTDSDEATEAEADFIEEATPSIAEDESIGDEIIAIPESTKSEEKKRDDVILKEELSSAALQIMGIFIIIIVLFTASVAIRSANKMPLSRGVSALIALLFTALPIIISYFVIGESLYWLFYLILLFSYLIFRTKDRGYYFQ